MRNSKILAIILAFFLTVSTGFAQTTKPLTNTCIVLVHGILGFDDTNGLLNGLVKYWGGVDGYLRNQGALVITPASSAMADIPSRSKETATAIKTWLATPATVGCAGKFHLIGHSQGGLVSRFIARNTDLSSKVLSVTTVNSLHKGAPMADIVLGIIPSWLQPFANIALSSLGKLVYRDGRPQDIIAMGKSLTVSYLKTFNSTTPNNTTSKYYSYGSKMAWADLIQHPLMGITHPITWAGGLFYGMGSANDGVVPFESQKWGAWKGEPSAVWYATGIDHLQATNFSYSGQNYFDVFGYYLKISRNAKSLL